MLLHHRLRIQAAVTQYVEPQIEAMLEELDPLARRAVRSERPVGAPDPRP